jgi:hypothetical protein
VSSNIPELGAVFWPVGTGDSSTLVVGEDVLVQVDLNHRAKADDDETPEVPVVDLLLPALPLGDDGKPYLAAFVLTHADADHCSGFARLLEEATIGELWATPRMWREYLDDPTGPDLCDDAAAFHEEVKRRVEAIKKAVAAGQQPGYGDRVLIVGYDTDHEQHAYSELPDEFLAYPGQSITMIDGVDHGGRFNAFIHAPFKDDCAEARNDTSLSMQVTLTEAGGRDGKFLLFGDLAYETIMKIFDYSERMQREQFLEWDLLLAPHHCSKKVMYTREDNRDVLHTDILDKLENHARDGAVVVASSKEIPSSDTVGANPPHKMAADRYKKIVDTFICTAEWPSKADPSPVVIGVDAAGAHVIDDAAIEEVAKVLDLTKAATGVPQRLRKVAAAATAAGRYVAGATTAEATRDLSGPEKVRAAIAADRGTEKAPATAVGFGRD